MKAIRAKAKELMKGACRLCPVCDGRVCAGEVPGMGGAGSGASFKDNVKALAELSLNMRLIHDVAEPDASCSWLGMELAMPVIASPLAGMFNFGQAVGEEDYVKAVLFGCEEAGVIGSTGDSASPDILDAALAGLEAAGGRGIPFIKPWEGKELDKTMERVFASGCSVMGMDIDAAGLVTLRKMGRPVGPKSVLELAQIVDKAHAAGVKFIVKGVMTVDDALLAAEAGADCIAVSNHGGRVLEAAPGTARVLPAIAEAAGAKVSVMVDGGVRNGGDVLKMLALGADVVGIGRPVAVAAIGGGSEGAAKFLNSIKTELIQTMILTGCRDVASIGREALFSG